MPQSKTFLITGVSSGLGRAFAAGALAAGHRVIGTVRRPDDARTFGASKRAFPLLLDVTDYATVAEAVRKAEQEAGPVDVLVNNAGYGHEGVLEESSMDDLQRQFAANVFGAVAMIKAVLPYMRQRRRGRILNITSMGGIITLPGLGYYHASKFALEGLSESLGKEVKDFGIHVTAVEPGSFRTDWAGRSMVRAPRSISDYDALMDPIRERRQQMSGQQIGNPARLGKAIIELVQSNDPPAHLLLGSDAAKLVERKLTELRAEYDAWKDVTLSTDFEEAAANSWA